MREMTVTDLSALRALHQAAQQLPRRRAHLALHRDESMWPDFSAPLQALIVAAVPGTYVVPHRFDRDQCFAVLTGEWGFLFWDMRGQLACARVCAPGEIVHVPAGTGYHTWVCRQPGTLLETLPGPHAEDRHDMPGYPTGGADAERALRSFEAAL